jgi:hypothetical protein
MAERLNISVAGNVFAPALAEVSAMGFRVTPTEASDGEHAYRAESSEITLIAPDTLQLLGLAVLASRRGRNATRPTDSEVDAMLRLDGAV